MRRGRVVVGAAIVLAVVTAALGGVADSADAQPGGAGYFNDDDGSVHEPALDALASRGVLAGIECGEGLICPSEPMKRSEMAVWLVRVLDGAAPSTVDTSSFSDVDYGAWWAPFVERLFEMGITVGCRSDPLQYCPTSSVTRAQVASLLARALGIIELPAAARFTAIDGSAAHVCGLRADSRVVCWGDNYWGQSDAPDGRFLAVSAGSIHSCGLRSDGAIVCWGSNYHGQPDASDGDFIAVAAGDSHACGLRADGTIACWGDNRRGWTDPSSGRFVAIEPFCGLRAGGAIACWGSSDYGTEDRWRPACLRVAHGRDCHLLGLCGIR